MAAHIYKFHYRRISFYGGYLLADSEAELHAFAQQIGLKREWADLVRGKPFPCYFLSNKAVIRAYQNGAEFMRSLPT